MHQTKVVVYVAAINSSGLLADLCTYSKVVSFKNILKGRMYRQEINLLGHWIDAGGSNWPVNSVINQSRSGNCY